MKTTLENKSGYIWFLVIISVIYLVYVILTPTMAMMKYKSIPRQYEISTFDTKVMNRLNRTNKQFVHSVYIPNYETNRYVLREDVTRVEKRKLRQIFNEIHFNGKITIGYYFVLLMALYLLRYLIAVFYREKPVDHSYTPKVSVFIPVKNEENWIYETIKLAYNTGYPLDKLEVIIVNDGSTDNTGSEIIRAKKDYPSLVVEEFATNQGKRVAITRCVEIATGEFYIMLDSDTFLEKDSIINVVQQFKDERVAAISGRTDVYNLKDNLLTRIQGFKYYVAYRLFKSFESKFGTVSCCPGCFSAYRASKIKGVMDEWNNRKFFGYRCVAGEDRALTTLLLKNNRICYSDRARAKTIVPETLKSFAIQQKRWMRSWFRESLFVSAFMWKKNPIPAASFYVMLVISFFAPMTLVREFVFVPMLLSIIPMYYYMALLIIIVSQSTFCIITKKYKYFFYGLFFTVFYFSFIIWLIPVAVYTVTSGNWGSRGAVFK